MVWNSEAVRLVERLGCLLPHARHRLWRWLGLQENLEAVQVVESLRLGCQVQRARHKLWV